MIHVKLSSPLLYPQNRISSSISLHGNSPVSFPHHVLSFLKVTYCHGSNCISKYTNIFMKWIPSSWPWVLSLINLPEIHAELQKWEVHLNLNNLRLQSLPVLKKQNNLFLKQSSTAGSRKGTVEFWKQKVKIDGRK